MEHRIEDEKWFLRNPSEVTENLKENFKKMNFKCVENKVSLDQIYSKFIKCEYPGEVMTKQKCYWYLIIIFIIKHNI